LKSQVRVWSLANVLFPLAEEELELIIWHWPCSRGLKGIFFLLFRSILEKEGPKSLFRGLGPNLVGVAPSR
jgi:hypothetical protein